MSCNNINSCGCTNLIHQNKYKNVRTFSKLIVCDWLNDIPTGSGATDLVEVKFKNTRKEYFENVNQLPLEAGDIVAVEASPGHDIGMVSLTGELVLKQLRKHNISLNSEFKKIYRKVKPNDLQKWEEVIALEHSVMIEARQIALDLKLDMKIGDVEFQGDKTKAIFYYIADERVDFRQLIKVLAERFKIRVEMKQIGARQEAGRIGGIGSCGRELCCSTWMTNFVSVTTNAARYQELSLNPQKLAGQCGKLKCCLNFELDVYLDAQKQFPDKEIPLQTESGTYYHQKTDVFKGIMWYSPSRESAMNSIPLQVELVKDIIDKNKKNIIAPELKLERNTEEIKKVSYANVVGQESLTRFDEKRKSKRGKARQRDKQNYSRRRGNPSDNRRDDDRRNDNRRNDSRKDDNRRYDNRPNDSRRDDNRRNDSRRNDNRRNDNRRNDSRRDDAGRDNNKRNDRRDDNRNRNDRRNKSPRQSDKPANNRDTRTKRNRNNRRKR